MERDTSRDRSGDQAAWRDLVARLELPPAVDPADAPWPDRENLRPAPAAPADARESPGTPGTAAGAAGPDASPQPGTPASRGRVIRPASFMRFSQPGEPGYRPEGTAARQAGRPAGDAQGGPGQGGAGQGGADRDGVDDPTHPDLGALDSDIDCQGADERYVPPDVPPLPKLDPVARGAWTALFGGPGYLFIATTLSWQVPGWAELAAIIAFIAGFVILVSRLGDGPSRRDGPDQGAVV